MELKEAVEKSKKGDILRRKTWSSEYGVTIGSGFKFISKHDGKETNICANEVTANDWQIIPAKKEMTDFREWFDSDHRRQHWFDIAKGGLRVVWHTSEQNRDLLYVDLMDWAMTYRELRERGSNHNGLSEALDKINAVLNPDQRAAGSLSTG